MNKYSNMIHQYIDEDKIGRVFSDIGYQFRISMPWGTSPFDDLNFNKNLKTEFLEFLAAADQETADEMLRTFVIPTAKPVVVDENKYSAYIRKEIAAGMIGSIFSNLEQYYYAEIAWGTEAFDVLSRDQEVKVKFLEVVAAADQETADEMLRTLTYPVSEPAEPEVRTLNQQELAFRNIPFIQAIAEGKTIQRFLSHSNKWEDTDSYDLHCFDCNDDKFRIKPDTTTYRVALLKSTFLENQVYTFSAENKEVEKETEECPNFIRWLTDTTEYEV